MSEDCHDSNNAPAHDGTQMVACHECGEAVKPEDAYVCELERLDGDTEIAVFHKGLNFLCPLKWAAKQLMTINAKLEAALNLMKEPDASSGL